MGSGTGRDGTGHLCIFAASFWRGGRTGDESQQELGNMFVFSFLLSSCCLAMETARMRSFSGLNRRRRTDLAVRATGLGASDESCWHLYSSASRVTRVAAIAPGNVFSRGSRRLTECYRQRFPRNVSRGQDLARNLTLSLGSGRGIAEGGETGRAPSPWRRCWARDSSGAEAHMSTQKDVASECQQ